MAKSMIFWIIIIMCMKDIMKNGRLWFLLKEKMNGWKKL
jgi:hypothetical protein